MCIFLDFFLNSNFRCVYLGEFFQLENWERFRSTRYFIYYHTIVLSPVVPFLMQIHIFRQKSNFYIVYSDTDLLHEHQALINYKCFSFYISFGLICDQKHVQKTDFIEKKKTETNINIILGQYHYPHNDKYQFYSIHHKTNRFENFRMQLKSQFLSS